MGGITSGVGIFSGINTAQLIDQLLALEARPKQLAQQRIAGLQQQRAAYLDINSTLLALKTASQKFRVSNTFKASKAESSNKDVLTATAGSDAVPGTYQFVVKRLVTNQQVLSRSFTDTDTSGVGAASFTFELGGGRVASETRLSELNGGAGVERGKITITDAAGATVTVDLSTAVTVGDVLNAINAATGVRVKASVDGDRIKITDANTAGTGALTIANAVGYNTATSLGIAKAAAAGFGNAVTGDAVRTLSGGTALSVLNDGTGVNIRDASDDLIITARDGSVHNIKLGLITHVVANGPGTEDDETVVDQTRASTLQDVINALNTQSGGKITAAINSSKTGLVLTDTTGGGGNLIVRSATADRTTAKDLGIETAVAGVASSTITGSRLIAGLNSVLVSSLNGGAGITDTALTITDRAGAATAVTISSSALAGSLDDVVNDINSQLASGGNGVRVKANRAGNGLALADDLSAGTGNIAASGAAATALGIAASGATGGAFNGSNLQAKWIGRATTLASLNGGNGIGTGTFRITDAAGGVATLTIGDSIKTVDDLSRFVNAAAGIDVELSVNSKGDGLIVRDTSTGTGKLKIEDLSGIVARNLNLVGEDDNDGGTIELDGSFERTVAFAATDSLNTVASKINSASVGVSAAIIRDGAGYRLSLTSQRSGAVGRATIDTGAIDLGLSTLAQGDDSVSFFGSGDPARGVLLTSSTNSLVNVVQGVTIDLKQTSDVPISLVVSRDSEAAEKAVNDFVTAYNAVVDKMKRYDSYDVDAQEATALFGDQTIGSLRSEMRRILQGTPDGVQGSFSRLFQIGIRFGDGSKLEFDSVKFREALAQDPDSVAKLLASRDAVARQTQVPVFDDGDGDPTNDILVNNTSSTSAFTSLGIAEKLAEYALHATSTVDGMLTRRGRTLDDQIRGQQTRIASFDQRLEQKRQRLERQFADMEQAIASLQSQSSALAAIGSVGLRR
jgi:flagellar hook-associated protein 2